MGNVLIREIELPATVEGVTVIDTNGDFNIYINSLLSPAKKQEALEHELRHIQCDHHYQDTSVADNEVEANQILSPIPIMNEVLEQIIE
jgi:hypothetical protein